MVKTEVEIVVNTTDATKSIDEVGAAVDNAAGGFENLSAGADGARQVMDEATGGLATRISNVGTGLKAMGKSAVTSFRAAIAGANGLKKALIATGIGALVVALGTIAAYWDEIVGFINGASKEQKDLLAETERTVAASQQALENTEASENSLKLAGKTEREIRNLKIQQTNELLKQTEIQLAQQRALRESQIDAAERNQTIAAGLIAFLTIPITALLATIDLASKGLAKLGLIKESTNLTKGLTQGGASLLGFDPEKVSKEADEAIAETEGVLRRLKNQRDGYRLQNQNEDEQAEKDAADAAAQAAQDKLDAEAKAAEELAQLKKNIADAEANTEAEIRQKEIEDTEAHYQSLIDQAIKNGLDTEELERSKQERLAILREGYRQADAEAQQIASAKSSLINDEEIRNAQELNRTKIDLAMQGVGALNDIAQAAFQGNAKRARLAFRINKALSLTQAIMSTSQAVTAALAQTTDPTITQSFRFANAAIAGAQGLSQIISISRQQFNPSLGGGTGSVPRPSVARPTMSFNSQGVNRNIGLDRSPNLANQISESLTGSPIKAYVVSQEVETQDKMNRKIRETATIG